MAKVTPEEIQEMLIKEAGYAKWADRVISWRAAIFRQKPPHFCLICQRKLYCKRLSANGIVQDMILRGEVCPDVYTVWNKVFE